MSGGDVEGKRAGVAVWVIGSLASVTFVVGVSAAVASPGGSDNHRVATAIAAVSPTTVVVPQGTTTSSTAAPATTTTAPPPMTTVTVARRPTATTTTVALVGSISGRVTHKDGAPVAGARVTLGGPHGGTVATDDTGRYGFEDLPPGQYDLSMLAESPAAPCQPQQPCVGSAIAMERRPVALGSGERHTEDWVYPYDSPPSYS